MPKIIKWYGKNCKPCEAMQPIREKIQEKYEGQFEFEEHCSNDEYELALEQKIRTVPTIIFIDSEGRTERLVGLQTFEAVEEKVWNNLTLPTE